MIVDSFVYLGGCLLRLIEVSLRVSNSHMSFVERKRLMCRVEISLNFEGYLESLSLVIKLRDIEFTRCRCSSSADGRSLNFAHYHLYLDGIIA